MITLTLPWPPSVNHYYRRVGNVTLISKEGRRFRKRVAGEVLLAGSPRVEGRLAVWIVASPPDLRRRDLDNVQKALLDALQHAGVYGDDSQIDRITVERGLQTSGGMVLVQVEAVTP
ncbi:MAG: RusA family crossover junction endodeoxyribonuclease [Phycisphaerales bacterium]|nr:RusA family crossover junction endodeoxyribonuclease [Phycisphaerales bacterium]